MRVLFITNIPVPYRVDFFNELGKKCALTVLFEAGFAKDRDARWKSDDFKHFEAVFLRGIRIGADTAFCPGIIKYLNPNRFDVIVVGMYSSPSGMLAIQYMKAHKIPFWISSDGGITKADSGFKRRIKSHFIGAASYWLSTGKATNEYLMHYGAKAEKIFVYPFTSLKKADIVTAPLHSDEKAAYRNKLNMTEKHIVLSVGQFIHRKGYDVLLKACRGLSKDYGIYIVGGTPTEAYLQMQREYGLDNIHFVDFLSKAELADYYKAASAFVLPTREDIWGLVVNGAMAYGLPVVTTDNCVAGTELVTDEKNGYIVPVEDEDALCSRLILCIDHAEQFGAESWRVIQPYTVETMAEQHYTYFKQMLEDK